MSTLCKTFEGVLLKHSIGHGAKGCRSERRTLRTDLKIKSQSQSSQIFKAWPPLEQSKPTGLQYPDEEINDVIIHVKKKVLRIDIRQ